MSNAILEYYQNSNGKFMRIRVSDVFVDNKKENKKTTWFFVKENQFIEVGSLVSAGDSTRWSHGYTFIIKSINRIFIASDNIIAELTIELVEDIEIE